MNQPEFPSDGAVPADVARALGSAAARLGPFLGRVTWHRVVGSTNDVVLDLAARGAAEGAVVVADAQTGGRGRLGRTWHSPEGDGLYVSVLLRPGARAAALLTLAAGVAIADGVSAATGLRPVLKWPNDIWSGGRKLGGILAEARSSPLGPSHVALGFGLNLRRGLLPPDVARRATSLEEELGREVNRGVVLAECLAALAARYAQLAFDGAGVLDTWRAAARPLLGRRVEWDGADGVVAGVAEDVDDGGALLVRTPTGRTRVIAGEIRWT